MEAGLVGREGFVGLPLVAGFRTHSSAYKVQREASSSDGDGNHIHNEILLGLPRSEQVSRRRDAVP